VDSRVAGLLQIIDGVEGVAESGPGPLPAKAQFPYVIVKQVTGKELENLTEKSGLISTIMQVECWDKDYEVAWALRELIKNTLLVTGGAAGTSGQVISSVNHDHDRELYDDRQACWEAICRLHIWWES